MSFNRSILPTLGRRLPFDTLRSFARTAVSFTLLALHMVALIWATPAWAAPTDQLWSHWATHDPQSTVSVDHRPWQTLLSRHVVASDDGINRVAYSDFDDSSKTLLNQYLTTLSNVQPTQHNQSQQLAYWVNLYNSLTVQVVLDHPKKDSIRSMGPLLSFGPWDKTYLTIEGKPVSLNDIEHRILRPIWQDHRLHFVLNCASIGCPNLSRTAYTSDNIEDALARAEQTFLQHPRALSLSDKGVLQLSSLFDWYREDFADNESALLAYLAEQRPDLAETLLVYPIGSNSNIDYVYDWSLNAADPR